MKGGVCVRSFVHTVVGRHSCMCGRYRLGARIRCGGTPASCSIRGRMPCDTLAAMSGSWSWSWLNEPRPAFGSSYTNTYDDDVSATTAATNAARAAASGRHRIRYRSPSGGRIASVSPSQRHSPHTTSMHGRRGSPTVMRALVRSHGSSDRSSVHSRPRRLSIDRPARSLARRSARDMFVVRTRNGRVCSVGDSSILLCSGVWCVCV